MRGAGKVVEYRIKWRGFASSQSVTWELASQMRGTPGFDAALAAFDEAQRFDAESHAHGAQRFDAAPPHAAPVTNGA